MFHPTLITSPRITADSSALMKAAQQLGRRTVRLPNFRPQMDLQDQHVSLYGEPLFAAIVSSKLNHVLIEPTYDWLLTLPSEYTQRKIRHMTLAEARSAEYPSFVKNADGLKGFEAKVYNIPSDLPSPDFYSESLPVLVAEPVTWEVEYRCFVLNREVVTLSPSIL
jgi:hypothetical protein